MIRRQPLELQFSLLCLKNSPRLLMRILDSCYNCLLSITNIEPNYWLEIYTSDDKSVLKTPLAVWESIPKVITVLLRSFLSCQSKVEEFFSQHLSKSQCCVVEGWKLPQMYRRDCSLKKGGIGIPSIKIVTIIWVLPLLYFFACRVR